MDIETNIPLPPMGVKPYSYPALYSMAVGESFARPDSEYKQIHSASQACRKKTQRRFAMRLIEENKVRIWRIL